MRISIGCDHGGLEYKDALTKELREKGHEIIDCGTYTKESCDYPDFARKAAELVARGEVEKGIVICTSGEGVCITANKVKGVRCGLGYNDEVAALMRQHNDCNMIAFAQKFMKFEDVKRRAEIFLSTEFEGGRHQRRVEKMMEIEK
jgi:ribose 5-phosphate isomerase B